MTSIKYCKIIIDSNSRFCKTNKCKKCHARPWSMVSHVTITDNECVVLSDPDDSQEDQSDWSLEDMESERMIGRLRQFREIIEGHLAGLANLSISELVKLLKQGVFTQMQSLQEGLQSLSQMNLEKLSGEIKKEMRSLAKLLGSSEEELKKFLGLLTSLKGSLEGTLNKIIEYSKSSGVMLKKLQKLLPLFMKLGSRARSLMPGLNTSILISG